MKFLLDIFLENGYKLVKGKHLDYSTTRSNGIDSRYENEKGDLVIWGINELGKPPTLIFPRPEIIATTDWFRMIDSKIELVKYRTECAFKDDVMNGCLSSFDHQDVYDGIINNWVFDLDNKTIRK
ncbi:hypothetical protein H0S70_07220 [Chryseobacterium manosquense]|uniref:Uncharacterized protein n=1 Tax=Chryseobacterium manosquense TaxID=2754694 RepID=A0A7H1DT88_9FLAO|nr:hypothetical protein [Chryseobacterium manosquense]QNS40196.1 hypothetical protein H0S70_07220 [Chryseobacterium manosquense]